MWVGGWGGGVGWGNVNVFTRQCPNVIPLVLSSKTHSSKHQIMKLPLCLTVLVVTVGLLHSAPEDLPSNISEDTLKRESSEGADLLFCSEHMHE